MGSGGCVAIEGKMMRVLVVQGAYEGRIRGGRKKKVGL